MCIVAIRLTNAGMVMYLVTMAHLVALALFSSVMQSAVLGIAGSMGPKVSAAVMFGLGMSGIMAFALSLLLRLILSSSGNDASSNAMIEAAALFAFSLAYTAVSTWVYHYCFSCRIQEVVDVLATLEAERSSPMLQRARLFRANSRHLQTDEVLQMANISSCSTFGAVMRQMWPQAFNVWLVFVVTMTVFPGVMHKWAPERILFQQLLTGCFQVFDVFGRYSADALAARLPSLGLWMLTIMRLLFVPAFFLGQWNPELCPVWGSDTGRMLLVALLALTNGFAASCAMMYGPSKCERQLREVAGITMGGIMVIGIFSGTLLALLTEFVTEARTV